MHILIADDHDLVRETVGAFLREALHAEVNLVGSQPEALEALAARAYDLVLLDYGMPGMNGLQGLTDLLDQNPDQKIAIMTATISRCLADAALAAGAVGFVPKTLHMSDLPSAISQMLGGDTFLPAHLLPPPETEAEPSRLPAEELAAASEGAGTLTRRERHVLKGICEGKANKEIARDLDLQEVTVKLYVKTLTRKLHARNRTHAAMIARDLNMV